ncbi:hypothetical protein CKO31_01150 [Thiohalocapsa halophila]|uniref:Guanylate cyclase domain-containing protein n=1 Tax=Thiohalocapsa halophila TaxID=69359 RepID=A0ABS1CBR1_9GAMM|nr:adenylate/guanylate cyclase domain-containing protein [Thiohalocapsa halophila]MBK1629361.1 hypothetical protein [Thiohalocapsa halophila]
MQQSQWHAPGAVDNAPAPARESPPVIETKVAIVLADIRGFTSLMASHPPRLMAQLLNRFLTAMCAMVDRYGGHVDKFMGDSVMAVFGVPQAGADDLGRALACAAAMQQSMAQLNNDLRRRGEPALYAGVAVNTGAVMAGSFGPAHHQAFTVIGESVNLAARMEGFSLRGQVLISAAVRAQAADRVIVGPANRVQPKGLAEPLALYPLRAVHHGCLLRVPAVEPRRSPRVEVDLDALFHQVQAKRVSSEPLRGRIRDIGYHGLSAELPMPFPRLTELAVRLPETASHPVCGDVYARVLRSVPEAGRYRTSLAITSLDTPAHRALKTLVDERIWRR